MFGLGFGEILIILVVGIVVVGPRRLPSLMRTAGQWVGKLRRMSTDLRSQSGIDELIRYEGLEKEIADLRALSRVNVMNTFVTPMLSPRPAATATARRAPIASANGEARPRLAPIFAVAEPPREREYPLIGCDAYDALADDVTPYTEPTEFPEILSASAAPIGATASEAAVSEGAPVAPPAATELTTSATMKSEAAAPAAQSEVAS